MGAVYDEDEELDFSFLKQSVRQTETGRQTDNGGGQRSVAVELWNSRSGQSRGGQGRNSRSGQSQGRNSWDGQSRGRGSRGENSWDMRGQGGRNRNSQGGQARAGRDRRAVAAAKNSQTMQERQRQRQMIQAARRKRRLRRQKQLLAVLLCILMGGTALAVCQLQRMGTKLGMESETGAQTLSPMQAEGALIWPEELGTIQGIPESQYNQHPDWTENFLTISEYSRPGEPLKEVKNIFVHYTANIKTSAAQNRSYFENLKDNHDVRGASAHFIIGIDGEILQIVPLDEMAYAVQTRNEDSISIECCYKYENGQFTQETYDSLIGLLAWLVDTYELDTDDILRHYDCGGKKCPLYYVEHEDAWRILKQDVGDKISQTQ